jgi:hypothetical protein
MKEKWPAQTEALIDGVSIAKAAQRCGVHYTTAFRWRHRFLASLAGDKPKALAGIVEGDETFILESFKGKRSAMPRKSRKRGGKSAKRGLSAEQSPVIVARDRQGATTDAVLPKLNRVCIAAALGDIVTPANEFCCDGGTAIVAFARRAAIPTHILPVPGKTNPASQTRWHPIFTSTTSRPTTLVSRSGCGASTASPRKTWRIIAVGGERSSDWATTSCRTISSSAPSGSAHINKQRHYSLARSMSGPRRKVQL